VTLLDLATKTSPDEAFRYVSLTVVPQAKQGESLHPEARPILIRTASSLTRVQDELEGIAVEIAILLAGAVVVVTLLSQRLAQHLLLPLRQLSEQAAAIRPGEAPSTMPNRGTGDELDRLAQTLDSSFAELHDALERQSRFSANAAHELRNPVAALLSSSEVALRRDRPAEEYPPFLIDIVRDAKRMQRIVEALLQLTRLRQRGSPEGLQDIELGPFVEDVIAELGHAARVQLRVEGRPHVPADPELLRILLQNLLHNAAQHGAPATPIRVTVLAAESPRLRPVPAGDPQRTARSRPFGAIGAHRTLRPRPQRTRPRRRPRYRARPRTRPHPAAHADPHPRRQRVLRPPGWPGSRGRKTAVCSRGRNCTTSR
jgi:signal transduction histidine kinase